MAREDIERMLSAGEQLEKLDLSDLDLAGLDLEGKSFRGSDVRGLSLYRSAAEDGSAPEARTNIKNTDWTDADVADLGPEAWFGRVEAEGATFGFAEGLQARRERLAQSGNNPSADDVGGYHNFNASEGNFRRTHWKNIDFGGGSGYEARFDGADLREAVLEGCDLTDIDLSASDLQDMKIKDPLALRGVKIREEQVSMIAKGIQFSDAADASAFAAEIAAKGERAALEEFCGIVVE